MDRSLKLSEKLFCLAVNPAKGGILLSASPTLGMTLAGSVFVELMAKRLISMEEKSVRLINPSMQSDPVHEFFLRKLREHGRPRKLRRWISYFNLRKRKIQKLVIREMVRKNVLRTEEHRILFIPYEKVCLADRELADTLRRELEQVIFGIEGQSDERIMLAVLVWRGNLLSRIFTERKRRKEAVKNLKKIQEPEVIKAVREAIMMANAATFAAIS